MSQKYIASTLKQNGEGGPELCQIIHAPEVGEFWQEPDLYFHDPAMKFKKAPHCPDHPNKKTFNEETGTMVCRMGKSRVQTKMGLWYLKKHLHNCKQIQLFKLREEQALN